MTSDLSKTAALFFFSFSHTNAFRYYEGICVLILVLGSQWVYKVRAFWSSIAIRMLTFSRLLFHHHKQCHHSYKTTSYWSQPTLKMLGYAEKDEMYLRAIIHQHLIISGDVELNPGPLGGEQILHSLGVCYCIILQLIYKHKWVST